MHKAASLYIDWLWRPQDYEHLTPLNATYPTSNTLIAESKESLALVSCYESTLCQKAGMDDRALDAALPSTGLLRFPRC